MAGVDYILHLFVGNTHKNDMNCTDLQCGTVRVRQVEQKSPCTLPALEWCPKLHRKWRPTRFETHLVSGRKWQGIRWPVRSSLCSPFMTPSSTQTDMYCTDVQYVTGRVWQVEQEFHVPCRLSVGAPKLHQNWGPPGNLKLTLFLDETGWRSIAFFTCSLAPHKRYRSHSSAVRYRASAAGQTGSPCTLPAPGCSPKLHQKRLPTVFETKLVSGQKCLAIDCILHLFVGAAQAIWIARNCSA